jgi:phospholipid transport system transporter-binding protein
VSDAAAVAQLTDRGGQGRCAVTGALTLASVPGLWKELQTTRLLATAVDADLTGVGAADSAGLALLVSWKSACRKAGHELTFAGVPARLNALAALTDAGVLLETRR